MKRDSYGELGRDLCAQQDTAPHKRLAFEKRDIETRPPCRLQVRAQWDTESKKRRIFMKINVYLWKETWEETSAETISSCAAETISSCAERYCTFKETYIHEKRMMKETFTQRISSCAARYCTLKETRIHEKDLYSWEETYIHEKRPIYVERDLQKRTPQRPLVRAQRDTAPQNRLQFVEKDL